MCFCPVSPCSRVTKDDVFLSEGDGVVSSGEVYPASRVRKSSVGKSCLSLDIGCHIS